MSAGATKIPIFIYPSELAFYSASRETHKQLLTLYNPYDIAVKFKIFSNASDKYTVLEPTGTIAPHSSLDVVVRHRQPIATNSSIVDKFMIIMQDLVTNQKLGKRYLISTLFPGEKDNTSNEDSSLNQFSLCEEDTTTEESKKIRSLPKRSPGPSVARLYVLIFLGTLLSIPLFLPTAVEVQDTTIPPFLHISVTTRATLSFILGAIFMCIIMPFKS